MKYFYILLLSVCCLLFSHLGWSQTIRVRQINQLNDSQWQLIIESDYLLHFDARFSHNPLQEVIDFNGQANFINQVTSSELSATPLTKIQQVPYQKNLRILLHLKPGTQTHLTNLNLAGHDKYSHQLIIDLCTSSPILVSKSLPGSRGPTSPASGSAHLAHEVDHTSSFFSGSPSPGPGGPTSPASGRGNNSFNLSHEVGEVGPRGPGEGFLTEEKNQTIPPPMILSESRPKGTRPIMIVIDPGHGGKDPGAIGFRGIREKYVVLTIAKRLQRLLNAQPGFRAVLTRNSDYYLTLRQRLAIARRDRGDMFIAIHADAYRNPLSHGVSVFALSPRGATSEAARWLADKENQSELMGGVNLSDQDAILKSVLLDLSQTATVQASLMIGQNLLRTLQAIAHLHHYRVEQAAFVVLKSPDIPSLLVETGFLSNMQEAQKLSHPVYQEYLARALMQGILRYFMVRPPPDTWLAAQRNHH